MQRTRDERNTGHLESVEGKRRRNIRQLLLRVSRIVNRHVVEGLNARGYANLRSTHTTLLSNIDPADGAERGADRMVWPRGRDGLIAASVDAYVCVGAHP